MTITIERAESLAKYLYENPEKAETLMTMSAEEACAKINAEGYDFSADELADFAEVLNKTTAAKQGELNAEDLDDVNGGILVSTIVAGVWYCAFVSVSAACAQEWLRRR